MAKAKYKYDEKRNGWTTLVWDGTYDKYGEKHRKRLLSKKSSRDLENMVAAFVRQRDEQKQIIFSGQTFLEYANHWLEISKAAKEKNTRKAYRNTIDVHLDFLADVPLTAITHSHFQHAINNQIDHPPTCDKIYITFRQIIKSAIRDHLLPKDAFDNICEDISLPHRVKAEKRPLTDLEKQALKAADLDPRKLAFVLIIYYCGLRRGEALALMPEDFDFENKVLRVSKVIIFPVDRGELKPYPKTGNGIRQVPMPDALIDSIKGYVESLDPGEMLFHTRTYRLMTKTGYKRMWDSIIMSMNKALGYNPNARGDKGELQITDLTAHIFRHNYCTELCYKVPEISTKMIAKLLGDNEKMVLDVYSHIVDEKENAAAVITSALAM